MTQFEIQSTQMRVTDPCYDKDTWCAGVLDNVLPGTWVAEKEVSDEGSWGMRIARLRVYHENYPYTDPRELTPIDVGVDSGQAGFFDESQYPEGSTGDYGVMTQCGVGSCSIRTVPKSVADDPRNIVEKNMLQVVFRDGKLLVDQTFGEIRERAAV